MMLIVGCTAAPSNPSPLVIPELPVYSLAVQELAVQELAAVLKRPCPRDVVIEGCSAVARFILDYADLRAALRELKAPGER